MPEPSATSKTYHIAGHGFLAPSLAAGLYVVATPIGNLRDITLRALETLAAVDVVLCEDTRLSARLLDHYGIRAKKAALHEHNERDRAETIAQDIAGGKAVALISDAGTPLLSDPGFPLVRHLREKGLPVFAIPGPSALLAGLASAGLPTDSFSFIGFLPNKHKARLDALKPLSQRTETLVFYESPRRIDECLAAMAEIFGPAREAVVALELTKKFERIKSGSLAELSEIFAADETKGEAVILVAGQRNMMGEQQTGDWQSALSARMDELPLREAVDEIATAFALKRKQVYDAALALKKTKG